MKQKYTYNLLVLYNWFSLVRVGDAGVDKEADFVPKQIAEGVLS